jgi:hypothetical protein
MRPAGGTGKASASSVQTEGVSLVVVVVPVLIVAGMIAIPVAIVPLDALGRWSAPRADPASAGQRSRQRGDHDEPP